jgi:hypothetical protein
VRIPESSFVAAGHGGWIACRLFRGRDRPVDVADRALVAHDWRVSRHDYLVNLLQSAVETCHYHPAVWWVSKNLRTERELCWDDLRSASAIDSSMRRR